MPLRSLGFLLALDLVLVPMVVSADARHGVVPVVIGALLPPAAHTYTMPFVEQALVIDARDDDWHGDAMVLGAGNLAGGAWDGVEDLHGELRLCWECRYLYFYLWFIDDGRSAPETHPKRLWENNGMQFAFDALANARSPYDDLRY